MLLSMDEADQSHCVVQYIRVDGVPLSTVRVRQVLVWILKLSVSDHPRSQQDEVPFTGWNVGGLSRRYNLIYLVGLFDFNPLGTNTIRLLRANVIVLALSMSMRV